MARRLFKDLFPSRDMLAVFEALPTPREFAVYAEMVRSIALSPPLCLALNLMGRCPQGRCRVRGITSAEGHTFQRFGEIVTVIAKVCVALERHCASQAKVLYPEWPLVKDDILKTALRHRRWHP